MSFKLTWLLTSLVLGCVEQAPEAAAPPPRTTEIPSSSPAAVPAEPTSPPPTAPSTPVVLVPLEPPKPPPGAVWPPPGGWTPPPCALEATAKVTQRGAAFHVSAVLRNLTGKSLELDVPDRCPQGVAQFSGLRAGYDYYAACVAGACPAPQPARHLAFAPGQSLEVASIEIDPKQTSCNAALPPGTYNLGFSVATELRVCGGTPGKIALGPPSSQPALPSKPAPVKPKPPCPPGPACGLACPGGRYAHDANGCSVCGCEPGPTGPTLKAPGAQW